MSRLIIISGIPGAGKSTYVRSHSWEGPIVVLSTDNIRKALTGDAGCLDKDKLVWKYIENTLADPQVEATYIVDATNLTDKRRKFYLRFKENFSSVELWYIYAPLEVCIERNYSRTRHVPLEVICSMYKTAKENMNFIDLLNFGYDKINLINNY